MEHITDDQFTDIVEGAVFAVRRLCNDSECEFTPDAASKLRDLLDEFLVDNVCCVQD